MTSILQFAQSLGVTLAQNTEISTTLYFIKYFPLIDPLLFPTAFSLKELQACPHMELFRNSYSWQTLYRALLWNKVTLNYLRQFQSWLWQNTLQARKSIRKYF